MVNIWVSGEALVFKCLTIYVLHRGEGFYYCWLLLLLLVLISTVSSPFLDAENLMVGDLETLER